MGPAVFHPQMMTHASRLTQEPSQSATVSLHERRLVHFSTSLKVDREIDGVEASHQLGQSLRQCVSPTELVFLVSTAGRLHRRGWAGGELQTERRVGASAGGVTGLVMGGYTGGARE